jgi:hypothetical protein
MRKIYPQTTRIKSTNTSHSTALGNTHETAYARPHAVNFSMPRVEYSTFYEKEANKTYQQHGAVQLVLQAHSTSYIHHFTASKEKIVSATTTITLLPQSQLLMH